MLVMFIVGLMFVGCLALYASAQFGSQDTHSMEQKNSVFDAAEAGLEDGVNALDVASSATGGSGTLTNGDSFNYTITTNATVCRRANLTGSTS
jgi:hypothetical protein